MGNKMTKGLIEELNLDEYVDLCVEFHRELEGNIFRGLNVNHIPSVSSVYFWIADKREAIFAIPSYSSDASEFGFRTTDRSLISALFNLKMRAVRTSASKM
jgi:hypothetical protein